MSPANVSRSFADSSVVITGASRGIGRRIALAFAAETAHPLFLIARDATALETVRRECLEAGAPAVETAVCDLTSADEINRLSPSEVAEPGILVNNAGTFLLKPLQETDVTEFDREWAINTRAPFLLCRQFLPALKEIDRGLIVNITSVSALKGQARSGAYSSTKHALLGLTRSLRLELRRSQVAVTAINLGQTFSTSWEGVDVDPAELIDPDDVARLIVTLSRFSPRTVAEEITLQPQAGPRSPD